jgi:hypothetical protein
MAGLGGRADSNSDNSSWQTDLPGLAISLVATPLILDLVCSNCGFADKALSAAYAVVDLEDGREEICPHPGERVTARKLTGFDVYLQAKSLGGAWYYWPSHGWFADQGCGPTGHRASV